VPYFKCVFSLWQKNNNACQDFRNIPQNVASGKTFIIKDLYRVLQKLTKITKSEINKVLLKKMQIE